MRKSFLFAAFATLVALSSCSFGETEAKDESEDKALMAAENESEAKIEVEDKAPITTENELESKPVEKACIAAETKAKVNVKDKASIAADNKPESNAEDKAPMASEKESEVKACANNIEPEKNEVQISKKQVVEDEQVSNSESSQANGLSPDTPKVSREERFANYSRHKRGFESMFDFSYRHPLSSDCSSKANVNYVAGYRFNNYLFVGGGLGLNHYHNSQHKTLLGNGYEGILLPPTSMSVPVFAYCRVNFLNRQISPFVALSAGYEIGGYQRLQLQSAMIKYYTGSAFVNPQIGVNFRTSEDVGMYVAFGFQGYTMPYCTSYTMTDAQINNKFICGIDVHVGVTF